MGDALGVLFAPTAGEKARETIKAKLKELELEEVVDRFVKAFEEGKKEAEKVAKEMEK
jgi:gas vesicle protein